MYTPIHPQKNNFGNVFGLIKYGTNGRLVVIVPGFGDGIYSSSWQMSLDANLFNKNYSILHLNLSSSYYGSGLHGIALSAEQIFQIIENLKFDKIILIGHSTGAQISLEFAKIYGSKIFNLTLVLLGPVSDRLAISSSDLLDKARNWAFEGRGHQILPDLLWNCPVRADRLLELLERGGADDYFSPDLEDEYINSKYRDICFSKAIFIYGSEDEYVENLSGYVNLVNKIKKVSKGFVEVRVISGDHYFSESKDLSEVIVQFLE